ncbi:hypothetical protein KP509_13G038800 [Ceratopteris richardii]|uniref:adenylate kinase n=1 Tax=Ceratopteris richardii TaxID=49495 RepID=A0A8T2TCU5_CERRI|nr:hypothetical protein KP509_13G038800 [Ceratopteris richardii]
MATAASPASCFHSWSCNERGRQLSLSSSLFLPAASTNFQRDYGEKLITLSTYRSSVRRVPGFLSRKHKGFKSITEKNAKPRLLKVMISGAPASGKGTQCAYIVEKYGLLHISTGDLLRAEVAAGTENGLKAKKYMTKGQLVPDDIVIQMVKDRLEEADSQGKGWLLDGFPRSSSQADALKALGIKPDVFIVLDVPEEVLIERVVGRRLDPLTGKIYHLKYAPPESEDIASRLTQRIDDTEDKAKVRLQSYAMNVGALSSIYADVMQKVDGNRPKLLVFEEIDRVLTDLQDKYERGLTAGEEKIEVPSGVIYENKDNWRGIPTRLNSIPHSREIREYFYDDVCRATKNAVEDGIHKLKVQITIPELNPEMDVYRIGTLLELMRELAFSFARDGKRVKVCVQGSMGAGIFAGMPLQLAGTRRMLEVMDWGEYESKGTFINIGSIGANEVTDNDDMFILMAPQNAVGNCIIDDLQAMVIAAGDRPVIIVNPRLKDLPSAAGVMQIRGREKRMEFAGSFFVCYNFRLLYLSGTQYPILGALRMAYPSQYELYKRVDLDSGKERYALLGTFTEEPTTEEITAAFDGRDPKKLSNTGGLWKILFGSI